MSGNFDEILSHVEARLPKDAAGNFISGQETSDVVHDLLAFLAERMLEVNKEKQQEIKGFLGWLEGYVGAKVDDLTPKTKIQSYYKHDYDGLLAVLKKEQEEAGHRSSPPGAGRGASGRKRGLGGQAAAAAG